jgi:D-glycero-D-manno-heptose 1,7-bisphosphate phosphatase
VNTSKRNKAVFIDRDGVINEERNYVYRIEDFSIIPGVFSALSLLRDAGYLLFIVTNQAGIARGYYGFSEVRRLHTHMSETFKAHGVGVDGIYYCPHHPQGIVPELSVVCPCRKPSPGMILQAALEHSVDLSLSAMVGDKRCDVEAARAAGVSRAILVHPNRRASDSNISNANTISANADFIASDLEQAAMWIISSRT